MIEKVVKLLENLGRRSHFTFCCKIKTIVHFKRKCIIISFQVNELYIYGPDHVKVNSNTYSIHFQLQFTSLGLHGLVL